MEQKELQDKSGGRHSQLIPWMIAIVSISLLTACFIANLFVTHHNFLQCKRGVEMSGLQDYDRKLSYSRQKLKRKGSTRSSCPVGWRAFQYNCYFPLNDEMTRTESEKNCTGMGAHLATISTEAEQDFIIQFLDRRLSYFLGLTDENNEGQWRWIDKTPFNPHMVFWHEGEPNNLLEEDCVVLVNDQDIWAWNDFPCDFEAGRICKMPGTAFN